MEPYEEEELRQAQWDRKVSRCPSCSICGTKIYPGEHCFQGGEIVICEDCLSDGEGEFELEDDYEC